MNRKLKEEIEKVILAYTSKSLETNLSPSDVRCYTEAILNASNALAALLKVAKSS